MSRELESASRFNRRDAFDAEDFIRMAAALAVKFFTAWNGVSAGSYEAKTLVDAFANLRRRDD